MIICDLCGEARDCLQKEIEGKEYDICSECWNPLAQKLSGKGRAILIGKSSCCRRRERSKMKSLDRFRESRLKSGARWRGH